MEIVEFINDNELTVCSENDLFEISFNKNKISLIDLKDFVDFIKGCEKIIRKTYEYTYYVKCMFEINLDMCQILGHIKSDDAVIEMHHGPMLTLFDICMVIADHKLNSGEYINTFMISDLVLDEHFAGNIQTVMLSETVHQLVQTNRLFIHLNQAHGNISEFLRKYPLGVNDALKTKIKEYVELCMCHDTTDNGLLDVQEIIYDWAKKDTA